MPGHPNKGHNYTDIFIYTYVVTLDPAPDIHLYIYMYSSPQNNLPSFPLEVGSLAQGNPGFRVKV